MTISTTVLSNFPFQGDLLDENGNITQQWRLFFQGMYNRLGGQTAPSNAVLGGAANDSAVAVAAVNVNTNKNTVAVAGLTTTSNANAATVSSLSAISAANATTVTNLTTTTNNNTTAITNLTAVVNAPPGLVVAIVVGASPFTFKALQKAALIVTGGTVSALQITRDGMAFYNTGSVSGMFPLSTNDSIVVTFSTAPIITFFPT